MAVDLLDKRTSRESSFNVLAGWENYRIARYHFLRLPSFPCVLLPESGHSPLQEQVFSESPGCVAIHYLLANFKKLDRISKFEVVLTHTNFSTQ